MFNGIFRVYRERRVLIKKRLGEIDNEIIQKHELCAPYKLEPDSAYPDENGMIDSWRALGKLNMERRELKKEGVFKSFYSSLRYFLSNDLERI